VVVAERAEGIVRRDGGFIHQIGEGKLLVDLLQFRQLITGSKELGGCHRNLASRALV
jgi:hypothetical protein